MCGITGIFETRERKEISRAVLARMNESQHHRGPDEGGYHVEPGVGLGHRRLSIIAVATGQQPLFNEDGSVAVIFNGEIYNFQELIPELTALGHAFRTQSDTEVIVHAWEAWGEACVKRFRGMFAFALWDRNRETLFLARDRLGVKPLYYALLADGTFIFGSELKSLLAHGGFSREHRSTARSRSISRWATFPSRGRSSPGAQKLPPAHTLTIRRGARVPEPVEYWDPRFTLDRQSTLEGRNGRADRARSTSPFACASSPRSRSARSCPAESIRAPSSRCDGRRLADPVNTCSISFADPAFDESRYASQVAQRYGTRHFVDRVESDDFDLIDTLARLYDEPFADSSAIPTYRVCQLARKHVTVALSGDGGDENFGGYRRYRLHLARGAVAPRAPASAAPLAVRAAGTALSESRLGAARSAREIDVRGAGTRFGRGVLSWRFHPSR